MKSTKVQTLGAKYARCSVAWTCVVDGVSNMSLAVTQATSSCIRGYLAVRAIAQVFQRLSHLLYQSICIARLCFAFRWEGMAASTNCSSHVNCYATLRTYLAQFVTHLEQRKQRLKLTEERQDLPIYTVDPIQPHGVCAYSGEKLNIMRAHHRSLTARARA